MAWSRCLAMATKLVKSCRFCQDAFLLPSALRWSTRLNFRQQQQLNFHTTVNLDAKSMEEIQADDIRADVEGTKKRRVAVSL